MGAIGSGGGACPQRGSHSRFVSPESVIDEVASREQKEAERREWLYREGQPTPEVQGRTVIMTHDVWQ
jgi:predicted phosphoribosyltransferase